MYKLALGNLGDFDATKSFPPLMNPKSSQVMDHHWDHLNRDASSNVLRASALGQKSRKPSARTKETLLLENWAPLNNKFVSQSKEMVWTKVAAYSCIQYTGDNLLRVQK